jgi:hypothetical protein
MAPVIPPPASRDLVDLIIDAIYADDTRSR